MSIRTRASNWIARLRHPALRPSLSVETHLTVDERIALFRLASRSGIRTVVEIGSYLGASALALAAGLRETGNTQAQVYCIDTWQNFGMSEGQRDTFAEFNANTAAFGDRVVPVRGWSTEVAAALLQQVGTIDLLFIDGDHSYDGVLADWRVFGPALKAGSVVALHDIGWAEGVQRVVAEEVQPKVRSSDQLPNLWWGHLA